MRPEARGVEHGMTAAIVAIEFLSEDVQTVTGGGVVEGCAGMPRANLCVRIDIRGEKSLMKYENATDRAGGWTRLAN
jgi:hypothetical protein